MQCTRTDQGQIAYFYCTKKQGEADGSQTKTVLLSLIRQLAWSADNYSISKVVKDVYDESRVSHESEESRLTIKACISLLTKLISACQNTTIIIDALDECSDPLELLSDLKEISSSMSGVKYFFSSRMNVNVHEEFPGCAKVETNSRSDEDIKFYIETEVKERKRRLLNAREDAQDLETRLVEILTRRAQGM